MSEMSAEAKKNLSHLSSDKKELLKRLLEERSRQATKIEPWPRDHITGRTLLPSSWSQRRLWFIDQFESGSTAYHSPMAFRIEGLLEQNTLQKALDDLVKRHEVLRTRFVVDAGDPKQEILHEGRFALSSFDLRSYGASERVVQVQAHKAEEAQQRFDLQTGPLIRGRLLHLLPEEHLLLITAHHIIFDGWSSGIFVTELSKLYESNRRGLGSPLKPLPIQYAGYAVWQQQRLQTEGVKAQLDYWRTHLKGAASEIQLPLDHARPGFMSRRGASVELVLDAEITAGLTDIARRYDMTLFMVMYAALAILLARLSGQVDIVIGTPVASRRRREVENLIGFFVNTLALRVAVLEEMRFEEFLERIKDVTLGAYDHQDVPFEQLVEVLQPQRTSNRNPLFQVMLTVETSAKQELRLPGLAITSEDTIYASSNFDLTLALEQSSNEIVATMKYATDILERETISRWMSSFAKLARQMTTGIGRRLDELVILPEEECRRVVELFNATVTSGRATKLIHDSFEEQVLRTPEAPAIICGVKTLTYFELNYRANQLAWHLLDKGVGPDQTVGICAERSLEMVVGLLGILKAGGAYVPLDPSYPDARLHDMVTDAAPRVILLQNHLRSRLPMAIESEMVVLDMRRPGISSRDAHNPSAVSIGLHDRNLAYAIYTSGSTGRPKGAMNEHRGVVNRLLWMQDQYRLDSRDRVLQKTPFSFDVSVWEFFLPLMSGACLIVAEPDGRKDPVYLLNLIENTRVTILHFVPSMLQSFLDHCPPGRCASLRHIICSGEELTAGLQHRCFECLPHARLSNLYGPTEAAIDVTVWECSQEDRAVRVPIGRPISNIKMYVLDSRRRPVPIGVTGEIYIGGVGVGRGYLNRPDITAERYVPDPFSSDTRARMYKTGDVGRWRSDGAIEYIGRNDYQIKIRGFRIELGEIEARLIEHPLVKEVVVTAREEILGGKNLVAYVVLREQPDGQALPDVERLRYHLKTVLPEYMIPSAFVFLDALPLSLNGKLDRRSLPDPDRSSYSSKEYESPQGRVEEVIAHIWKDLLQVERVGRKDNFFELGGHSLLATRMISKIREALHVELPLRIPFDAQVLEDLSLHVKDAINSDAVENHLEVVGLARRLRQHIDGMDDDEVLAEILRLEKEADG
jgi:amino acid adenylation domain-containing protein